MCRNAFALGKQKWNPKDRFYFCFKKWRAIARTCLLQSLFQSVFEEYKDMKHRKSKS